MSMTTQPTQQGTQGQQQGMQPSGRSGMGNAYGSGSQVWDPFNASRNDWFARDPFYNSDWGMSSWPSMMRDPLGSNFNREMTPALGACDIVETKDAHIMRADAPGMAVKDIKVQVTDDNLLTISGERSREREEKSDRMHRMERTYGRFVRSFTLPQDADHSKISAKVDRGVIEVNIPKRAEMKSRTQDVPIKG